MAASTDQLLDALRARFRQQFGEEPLLIASPGRVNLIGEHTDYNQGFVLPAAIDKAIFLAVSPRPDNGLHLVAHDLNATYQGHVTQPKKARKGWANYPLGVVDQLRKLGKSFGGMNVVFGGTIPIGSGLSSSAALENGVGFAFNEVYKLGLERIDLVKLSQRAENEWVGVKVGIMDMFASMMGRAGHALQLDCRSLDVQYVPITGRGGAGHPWRIVLCDTQVKHSLASSEYNTRRAECDAGVALVRQKYPAVQSLRDVSVVMLDECVTDPLLYRRCRYVLDENARLLAGVEELKAGDLKGFGQRMYGSHAGLSRDYEVSCAELDVLVEIAKPLPGVYGARMTGGGFGGCTVNLVEEAALPEFERSVKEGYAARFGKEPLFYVCQPSDGTRLLS